MRKTLAMSRTTEPGSGTIPEVELTTCTESTETLLSLVLLPNAVSSPSFIKGSEKMLVLIEKGLY